MRRPAFVFVVLAVISIVSFPARGAVEPLSKLWVAEADVSTMDEARSMRLTPDGTGLLLAGHVTTPDIGREPAVLLQDTTNGAVTWQGRPWEGTGEAHGAGIAPDAGRVFVTGGGYDGTTTGMMTAALDAVTGEPVWTSRRDPATDAVYDHGTALVVSADGSTVYVTGRHDAQGYGPHVAPVGDYLTVAYDASTGAERWSATYDSGAADWPTSIALAADGSALIVTGWGNGTSTCVPVPDDLPQCDGPNWDFATVAYDPSTGALLWASVTDIPASASNQAASVTTNPASTLAFVTGDACLSAAGGDTCSIVTVAHDIVTGAKVWDASFGTAAAAAQGGAIAVAPDGGLVFVAGTESPDLVTLAYDASTGVEAWASRTGGGPDSAEGAAAVAIAPNGSAVYVAGWSDSFVNSIDSKTIAYDPATGAILGAVVHDAGPDIQDRPTGLTVAGSGQRVYVAGARGPGSGSSTIALCAFLEPGSEDCPPPDTSIAASPPLFSPTTDATFELASTLPGATFECALDESPFEACSSPKTFEGLADGAHTFSVRAVITVADPSPATYSWTVDTTPPDVAITRPAAGVWALDMSAAEVGPPAVVGTVTVVATAGDDLSGIADLVFTIDGTPVPAENVTYDDEAGTWSFSWTPSEARSHEIVATARNGAGLTSDATVSVFAVPMPA